MEKVAPNWKNRLNFKREMLILIVTHVKLNLFLGPCLWLDFYRFFELF